MPTELTAKVTLIDNMHFHGENHSGMGVEMDSQPADVVPAGPTPMELVLQAAGGCTLMDVAFILRKRRVPPVELSAELLGIKRDEHPRIYEKIEIIYRAKGEGITTDELERAVKLSLSSYCSVFGMLQKVAEVTWRCEVI